jgi:hypothetical protein
MGDMVWLPAVAELELVNGVTTVDGAGDAIISAGTFAVVDGVAKVVSRP